MILEKHLSAESETSMRLCAIVAGLGILLMAILAPIANFGILPHLIVPGDAQGTFSNIVNSAGSFRIAVVCFLIVALLDIVVAWALYVVLSPVNKNLSLFAAFFRLVYAGVFASAIGSLAHISQLIKGTDSALKPEMAQVQAQAMFLFNSFQVVWDMSLVIFGFHLAILGILVFRSGYFPRFLGVFVLIASFGYVVDGFIKLLLPDSTLVITTVTFVGEVLLMVWLFLRGIRGFEVRKAEL